MAGAPGPGTETDRGTLPSSSVLDRRPDHWVIRTPDFVGFHCGNCLVTDPAVEPADLERWMAIWRAEFGDTPGVGRVMVQWEDGEPDGGVPGPYPAPYQLGVMRLLQLGTLQAPRRPAAIQARPLATDAEWAEAAAIVRQRVLDDGFDDEGFVAWRFGAHTDAVVDGRARWWGAFRDNQLLGLAGLYESPDWARYQEVVTVRAARRQGVATTLVHAMAAELRRRRPDVPCYIAANRDEQPERIYRGLGFEPVGRLFELTAPVPD